MLTCLLTLPQTNTKPISTFTLVHAAVKVATTYQKKKYCLEVSCPLGEQFYLQADTQKMMDDWYITIYKAIEQAVSALQSDRIVCMYNVM